MLDLPRQQRAIAGELDAAVRKVIREARYLPNAWPTPFEEKLAAYCGRPFAVGVGSGSSALQIALLAAGVKPGHEVITVPNSFFATTEAILLCGARPRFVDVDPGTHLMRVDALKEIMTPRTAAILPVHLFGNVVDVDTILATLERFGREDVVVLEDCAHAIGATRGGRHVPIGPLGAFSFNPGKNIGALGDAGAIVTSEHAFAETARLLRDHGRASKNQHVTPGFNSRLGMIDDAVLTLKLDHLDRWNDRRRRHAAHYDVLFADAGLSTVIAGDGVLSAVHQYVIRVDGRDDVRRRLSAHGVESGIHYPTLIVDQPPLRRLGWSGKDVRVAAALNPSIISLPCFPELEENEVAYVAEAVVAAVDADEEGAA